MFTAEMMNKERVARTAEKIQNKIFRNMWNYEVLAVCCILLADEIRDAETDKDKLLDDVMQLIRRFATAH